MNKALERTENKQITIRVGVPVSNLPEQTEQVTYSQLVKINKQCIDDCSELMRLYAFRQEAILEAIYIEDLQMSKVRVEELGA